jgi:ABC-2 type transport system permease protein
MNRAWIIAKRELQFNFDSLIAYMMVVGFLLFTGGFTWLNQASNVFAIKQADLGVFFGVARWTLFFFIPALTMRMLAEERKSGTIELLLTRPINSRQVILGKFFSCWIMVAIALALTLPYYFTVAYLGDIDHAATLSGYLGLLLMSAAYIAIGLFAGSLTDNQIVALLAALFISIFFQLLFEVIGAFSPGRIGEFFYYLSMNKHIESLSRGVLDLKDLVYFSSITLLGLYLAELNLSKRK